MDLTLNNRVAKRHFPVDFLITGMFLKQQNWRSYFSISLKSGRGLPNRILKVTKKLD